MSQIDSEIKGELVTSCFSIATARKKALVVGGMKDVVGN